MKKLPRDNQKKLNIDGLEKVFKHMSKSYKLFWFAALLEVSKEEASDPTGDMRVTLDEMANEMIRSAWKIEQDTQKKLKDSDAIRKIIEYLQQAGLAYENDWKIILEMINSNSFCISKKRQLILYVPYRFQSPFLGGITWDKNMNQQIAELNSYPGLIYSYGDEKGLSRSIMIQRDWAMYFSLYYDYLKDWVEWEAAEYINSVNFQKKRKEFEGIILQAHQNKEVKTCLRCGCNDSVSFKSRYCRGGDICADCKHEEDKNEKYIKMFSDIRLELEVRSLEKWHIIKKYLEKTSAI